MINEWSKVKRPEQEELERRLEAAREGLAERQLKIRDGKVPVFVLFEGFGAAGKGSVLGKIIKNMDPRFYSVDTMKSPTEEEMRKPFLCRYFERIPEAGRFVFLDGGWVEEVVSDRVHDRLSDGKYKERVDSIKRFERTLTDNGYLVMKFFFHIDKDVQKERLETLEAHKNTSWRVSKEDLYQNRHYKKYSKAYNKYLDDTNVSNAPWYLIDGSDKKWAELQILELLNQGIDTALTNNGVAVPIIQNIFPMVKMPKLAEVDLNKSLTDEEYDKLLDKYQEKLGRLHNELYRRKVPVIIAYEGYDAAGKGGNIKRVAAALDARGYVVNPIASPEPHEKARHYLWRFWTRLPKTGHVAIFDRTWYGRVMVERIEGFCSENDWRRAYNEINEFEKELYDWGAVVVKFWVDIDKDTQLERFNLRQNTPAKQWKITDEDWRNREKWDQYERAVDEMFEKTSTVFAPWHILESNDKKYARVKALNIIIDAIEKRLEK